MQEVSESEAQRTFEELMGDPHYAHQLSMTCLLGVAVVELLRAGFEPQTLHEIIDMAIALGQPEQTVLPWVYLLAYATLQFGKVGIAPEDVHKIIEGQIEKFRQMKEAHANGQ